MALLNFSGFKDAAPAGSGTSLPAGIGRYLQGKFPALNGSIALNKAPNMGYGFDATAGHVFTFNNNVGEYGFIGFDVRPFVGTSAPVGATLTIGYLASTSINRTLVGLWLSKAATALGTGGKKFDGGAAMTGVRYIEWQIKKTSSTDLSVTVLVNGVTVSTDTYTSALVMSDGAYAYIGYAGGVYGDTRYGATGATLSITDIYVSYNTSGASEFLGRPTITRVATTLIDRGSWTNANGTYTDQQIADNTTKNSKVALAMTQVLYNGVADNAFSNSRLSESPIIFKADSFTPAAGTVVKGIQATSLAKSLDTPIRTPQKVVLKDANSGDVLASGSNNELTTTHFTGASACVDMNIATDRIIIEVSCDD